jgi:hypothetical protein
LKKQMYAVKLNASLKSLEWERDQVYTQLCEVHGASKDLTEHVKMSRVNKSFHSMKTHSLK